MADIEIYFNDLIPTKQQEILDALGNMGNYDVFPIATIEVKDEPDWDRAINYLNSLIAEYTAIGPTGLFGLNLVLLPLKNRYDKGERTRELYDAILECE